MISQKRDRIALVFQRTIGTTEATTSSAIVTLNVRGRDLGTFRVRGAKARDWEDMASAVLEDKPCLLLADVGDNRERRIGYTLYLVAEPELGLSPPDAPGTARVLQTVHFRYEDGPRDCESVALDPTTKTVLLVTKQLAPTCTVFALAWPIPAAYSAYCVLDDRSWCDLLRRIQSPELFSCTVKPGFHRSPGNL